jgi:hypothetical protein
MTYHGRPVFYDCLKLEISQLLVSIATKYTGRRELLVVEIQQNKLGTTASIDRIEAQKCFSQDWYKTMI